MAGFTMGIGSVMTLDPSPRLRALRREIVHRNTMAESWHQTADVLARVTPPPRGATPSS